MGSFFKDPCFKCFGAASHQPEALLASIRGEGVGFVNPRMRMVTTEVVENPLTMLFSGFVCLKMLASMDSVIFCYESALVLHCLFQLDTLPETNSLPLKMVVSNRNLLFQGSIFRRENVSFREGNY